MNLIIKMKSFFTFIKNNLIDLFSLNYFISLFVMISLAWMLNLPALNPGGYHSSRVLLKPYEFVLIYFITLNILLHIGSHLKNEIKTKRIGLLRSKFPDIYVICLYISLYILFYFVFSIVPTYTTALMQQWINAPASLIPGVFAIDAISALFGYGMIWILLTVYLMFYWHSENKILLVVYSLILVMASTNFLLHVKLFNMNWIAVIYFEGLSLSGFASTVIWILLLSVVVKLLSFLSSNLSPKLAPVPYNSGRTLRLLELLKMDLTKHHLNMLGLGAHKILILFFSAGTALLYILMRVKGADFTVLAKIYLGDILPIAFSFNQQHIIDADKEAGMLNSILLRYKSYMKIIINRWNLISFPQIIIVSLYFIILFLNTTYFNIVFYLYVLALNLLAVILNLFFHLLTGKSGIAKILVMLLFYIPLRADIQGIINSSYLIRGINIFYSISQTEPLAPTLYQQAVIVFLLFISFMLTLIILRKKNNATNI